MGDENWKRQALKNTEDMVLQYRNHPSVILWGVRINESQDDDRLYEKTNEIAHELDDSRQTGGVRYLKKSHFLEDVYTYNDFRHDGIDPGCEKKKNVTPDEDRPYLISECNGHMYPTKTFDSEAHRTEHMLRHANVLDAVLGEGGISGVFSWCMFDYNTHPDFGSGDRICYHGVMDMYRNPKLAASLYAAQQEEDPVLEISSSMDIGEHPSGNPGLVYIISNADEVRMYKGGDFVKSYYPSDSPYKNLKHGPILIDDYVGPGMGEIEGFPPKQEKDVRMLLNYGALYGYQRLPGRIKAAALRLMLRYGMRPKDAYLLNSKYIGNWGDAAKGYRFEAVKDGRVVRTVVKAPAEKIGLYVHPDHTVLKEETSYDVSSVRIEMRDQNGNRLPFYNGAVSLKTNGPIEIIGPKTAVLRGGCGGTYVKTAGVRGEAALILHAEQGEETVCRFTVEKA
ncbi:MAG: glycoside hydrolase family 2 TIM barrel-domain containing protein [Eubacteriales bacterium]|nr:glycoside hydrolase family 2 TIM barrel-domain containing protein [Eubacteriales bacterium]